MIKYLEKIIISILIIIISFNIFTYVNKINKLNNELNNYKIEYNNSLAASDSLKEISNNLYEKLSFVNYSDSLLKIENEQLGKKLNGSTQQIVNLNLKIKELKESITINKPDTVIVIDNNKKLYSYNFIKDYKDYVITTKIGVYSNTLPESLKIDLKTQFNPLKINIYTKKIDEYKYSIYVNTNSDFIQLTDATSYINIDKKNTSFLSNFNAGLGIGMMNTGDAFVSGNIKFTHHNFGIIYSGNNGHLGGQYIYFIR